MKTKKFTTGIIVEIAIFAAIALALDFLQGGLWRGVFVNGGSIGLAMIPIFIIGYRRGFIPALITGLIVSMLQMMGGVYVISTKWYNAFLQIGLDYLFTYPVLALCAIFRNPYIESKTKKNKILMIILGTALGGLAKFLLHFLAGILFWQNFSYPGGYIIYSLVYNGSYMLPNIILCTIIMVILAIKTPQFFDGKKGENDESQINENC